MLRSVFPDDVRRTAGRAAVLAFVLAGTVLFLFPAAASAGTESLATRVVSASSLAVSGLLLGLSARSAGRVAVGAIVAAGALLTGAAVWGGGAWLVLFAAVACLYTATAFVPRAPREPVLVGTTVPDTLRDGCEAVLAALVLALLVREFGFEAFKIPTGSMEPTILGNSSYPPRTGDSLLALKPVPLARDPRRWEIWVFRYPLFRGTNYIKRIVGLPGEEFEIRGGDLYSNGVLARKPDEVQEAVWKKQTDSADRTEGVFDDRFQGDPEFSILPGEVRAEVPAGELRWLRCSDAFESDFRVRLDVADLTWGPSGSLVVELQHDYGDNRVTIRADGARLEAPGIQPIDLPFRGDALGRDVRLAVSVADRIVRVQADERTIARVELPELPAASRQSDRGRFRVGAQGTSFAITRYRGEEDVQYQGTRRWTVPADGFVALGDNVHSSLDSREWRTNVIRLKDGRTFEASDLARIRSDDRQETNFRMLPDGGVEFHDSYGVPRRFGPEELDGTPERSAPAPFVRRGDLVGPAFLIILPVRPEFRPRILR